jgi:hypothetical protein
MCLINNKAAVEKFLAKPYQSKLIKAYKIVETRCFSKSLVSKIYEYVWVIGANVADKVKKNKGPYKTDGKDINNGIHVYLSKKVYEIRRHCNTTFIGCDRLITVWVRKEDLLGVSANSETAVFRKVILRKAEYNRAIA